MLQIEKSRSAALRRSFHLSLAVLAASALVPFGAASAKQRTVSSFCSKASCADGTSPSADLVMDEAGNLYGTTLGGGVSSSGTVFRLSRDTETGKWKRKVLHNFCQHGYPCADGTAPTGKLVVDASGNLYGTALGGGKPAQDAGVVFKLSPDAGHERWKLSVLHAFCEKKNCGDGKSPASGLTYQGASTGVPYDGTSPLFGTAQSGGVHGRGVAFQIAPVSGQWSETVIYSFCTISNCSDGAQPWQNLVMDGGGNLFGVTYGRDQQNGVAFELSPAGGGAWKEMVLRNFCQDQNCADGRAPNGLTIDSSGDLVGTTYYGGARGAGTLFKITPAGSGSPYTVLHHFCSKDYCADGSAPSSTVTVDAAGYVYGTTYNGGMGYQDRDQKGGGTVFRYTPSGGLRVLRNFCTEQNCADGEYPNAGVLIDGSGNIFGTTQLGGKHGATYQGGTAFQISH
ncbi:MAG: hypothetical protein JO056_12445 [Alphaproteobacteria bacterium]|nr:hypothetical protein [Alphaproteobacteria bacterium]